MKDKLTKRERSQLMAKVRGHGNKSTELALAKFFRKNKITGWRRNQKLFGKPDFVFRQMRLAVFVDGCFWHGCPKHGTQPVGNRSFWKKKFARNQARDKLVNRGLRRANWWIFRIWEHDLHRAIKDKRHEGRLVRRILSTFSKIRLNS